jgi:hypothetical protein
MILTEQIRQFLTDELRRPQYQGDPNPVRGHCYVASEAIFHLSGGKAAGFQVYRVHHENDTHWFLRDPVGNVVDPTWDQFSSPVPYGNATRTGFLTRQPSRRAQVLMHRVRGCQ